MQNFLNIAIVFSAQYKIFYQELIANLKRENPKRCIYVYVLDRTQLDFVSKNFDTSLLEDVIFYPNFSGSFDEFSDLSRDQKISKIQDFEKFFNCSANSLLVVDRHFGRGYSPGGFFHAKAAKIFQYGYMDAIYSHINVLNFFKDEIFSKKLNLFIGGSSLVVKACEITKIPYRGLVSARFENRYAWCVDQYWSNPLIKLEFDAIDDSEITKGADIERYYESKRYRSMHLARQDRITWLIKAVIVILVRFFRNSLRKKSRTSGQYLLLEQILFAVRRYLGRKCLRSERFCMPLSGAPERYIFYPLQTEPEATLQAFSPEFFFQHTLIVMLSKATPFDLPVLVKETFLAAGRRPKNFYAQLMDLLNVSFLDMNEEGVEVVKKATIVCTISGTAGIEAALMGKPVLNFGQHNCYDFLDHSISVRKFNDVETGIQNALAIDAEKAKRDGLKFQEALRRATFDMQGFSSTASNNISQKAIGDCLKMLGVSLAPASVRSDIKNEEN